MTKYKFQAGTLGMIGPKHQHAKYYRFEAFSLGGGIGQPLIEGTIVLVLQAAANEYFSVAFYKGMICEIQNDVIVPL